MASLQQEIKESGGSVQEAAKEHIDASKDSATAHQSAADQTPGVLQQTGEKVMSLAQGAVDTVKNTLGAGSNAPDHKN